METLARPLELDLEQAMEFCAGDECVEVTPQIVRVRKVELDATLRGRSPLARQGPRQQLIGGPLAEPARGLPIP